MDKMNGNNACKMLSAVWWIVATQYVPAITAIPAPLFVEPSRWALLCVKCFAGSIPVNPHNSMTGNITIIIIHVLQRGMLNRGVK